MNTRKVLSLLLSVGLAGFGSLLADRATAQTTPISNLSQPVDNSPPVGGSFLQAVSFTTQGTANYLLNVSVSLSFHSQGGGSSAGPFVLSLYNNAAGSTPGTSLATLSGSDYPTNTAVYTYTNPSSLLLSANTTYWIVASSPASTGLPEYVWLDTYSASLDSGSIWTLGVTEYNEGSGWTLNSGAYLRFSVTVASTNAPALSIFQPVVLTYTTVPALPFVLQESPVLPGTNWVTATNAIQMATVNSGQAVFIVPPSGQQMFFRLQGP